MSLGAEAAVVNIHRKDGLHRGGGQNSIDTADCLSYTSAEKER